MLSKFITKSQLVIFFLLIFLAITAQSIGQPLNEKRIIVIDKAKKKLVLFINTERAAEFPAAFGIDPHSDKYKSLDGATPEGFYVITYKKQESEFHRFLGISYPNLADATRGLAQGIISLEEYKKIYQGILKTGQAPWNTGLGGGIGIHGGGVFKYFGHHKETDWTEGCIALNNKDIEKLFHLVKSGDPVIIFNSNRNLAGIIRPFTHIKDTTQNGVPNCPKGVCVYRVHIPTHLGQTIITLKEGKDYGRSLKAIVYYNAHQKPFFVLVDKNADGYIASIDSVSGPLENEKSPNETYSRLRKAVISALSMGHISYSGCR
jgi:hypothetical protein